MVVPTTRQWGIVIAEWHGLSSRTGSAGWQRLFCPG